MRRRRWGRLAAFLVIVGAGLYVTADLVALKLAEGRASNELAQATAAEKMNVQLGGFPFLPGLLKGSLRRVDVEGRGVSGGGLRVARLQVHVNEARFPAGAALRVIRSQHAKRIRVTAQQPFGRAEITEGDLKEFLQSRRQFIREVRIIPEGVEVIFETEPGQPAEPVRYYPRIVDRRLSLVLVQLPGSFPKQLLGEARAVELAIDLPRVPSGLQVDIRLGGGNFVIEATAPSFDVLIGEGGLRSRAP